MTSSAVPRVPLPGGPPVPALGLGTWRLGESARSRATEVAAVRHAIELGYRLFDTAEMYGEGGAETVLGQALAEALRGGDMRRDELFVVSKVYPHHAGPADCVRACERSLARLGLDAIDLYLLHWRGGVPLAQTVAAFESLQGRGRIRRWGVSNFDVADMDELWRVPGGGACAANQVYHSLSERGIEFDLVPWQRARGVPFMAYCPIDQGTLARSRTLAPLAQRLGATPAQVALAWLVDRGDTIAVPKAASPEHQRDNLAAAGLQLDDAARTEIDRLFSPPSRKQPLAMS